MCRMSQLDDVPSDPKLRVALEGAATAMARFAKLGNEIANGATRHDFPNGNADAAISEAMGEATSAFFNLRLAVISAAMGETCRLTPNPETVMVELQRRVTRNEERQRNQPKPYEIVVFSADDTARQVA